MADEVTYAIVSFIPHLIHQSIQENPAAVFDLGLKKKKKKSTKSVAFATEDSEGIPVASPVADGEGVEEMETSMENMFLDLKKKKKKKKSTLDEDMDTDKGGEKQDGGNNDDEAGSGGDEEDGATDFAGLKKKKKKKPAVDLSAEQLAGSEEGSLVAEEGSVEGDTEMISGGPAAIVMEKFTDLPQSSDRDYTYNEVIK
jgi:hypothetical protein